MTEYEFGTERFYKLLRGKFQPLAPFPTRTPRIDQLVTVIFGMVEPSLSYEAHQHDHETSKKRMPPCFKQLFILDPCVIDARQFEFFPRQLGSFVEGHSRPRDMHISRNISCSFFWLCSGLQKHEMLH